MTDTNNCPDCHSTERIGHLRQGRKLEYFTIGWNMVEAGVAVGAGWFAGSIALVGFGVDSLIESISGSILLWRLSSPVHDQSREQTALKLVGISFLILAAYVAFGALKSLLYFEPPNTSLVGIGLSIISLILMPILARAKRRSAANLNSRAMKADSRQTDLCAYLSAILLGGLVLNAIWGWWWADPLAALIMVPIIAREGFEGLQGEVCDDCH
jgi:divalent metal cation (Fe/Co/Zn/Cd) transporter